MKLRLISAILLFYVVSAPSAAQQLTNPPCDPLSYFNPGGQELVYRHAVPTPWFAVRMTAEWVATIDTAYIGMGVDRASTSGLSPDTLEVRVLADQLPTYFILDQLTVLIHPNLNGLVVDAMYIVEFLYDSPVAWVDPPDDFYLAWRVRGPSGDIARILMTKPALEPRRSVIINTNNTTTLATDYMRTQLQLGSADSVEFKTKVHACWPYGYPVELTSFTARYLDGAARLEWTTATEENNSGFVIERLAARSEQGSMNVWQRIGFVEGNGTTNVAQRYSFIDLDADAAMDREGIVRYRLRQVDFDGRTDVSPVVEIVIPQDFVFGLDQAFPNPLHTSAGRASVSFTLPSEQHARLELFDALGRPVAVVADAAFPAGRTMVDLPIGTLRSGVYFYRLTSAGQTLTRRISVVE